MSRLVCLALLAGLACGGTTQLIPASAVCRLNAVAKLPLDNPDAISVGDVKTLAADLKACAPQGDAGPTH